MNQEEQEQERNYYQGEHHPTCPQHQQNQGYPAMYPKQQGQSQMWQPQTAQTQYQQPIQPQYQQPVQPQFQQPVQPQVQGSYLPQPSFAIPQYPTAQPVSDISGMLPLEQSYIENILRLNRGKLAKVYMTFENNAEWNAKIFTGIIEAAGRDHIILSDPETGRRYLLLMVYLDYVEFNEELNYNYSYNPGQQNTLTTQPPR